VEYVGKSNFATSVLDFTTTLSRIPETVSFVQILHAEKDAKLEERNNGEQV
jgi:hypothetical protein